VSADELARVVDAAYMTGGDDQAWLLGLLRAARPRLDAGLGVMGVFYDIGDPTRPVVHRPVLVGTPPGVAEGLATLVESAPPSLFEKMQRAVPSVATLSERLGVGARILDDPLHAEVMAPLGIADFMCVAASDASGKGCLVGALLPTVTSADVALRQDEVWTSLAAHVTAGMLHRRDAARGDASRASARAASRSGTSGTPRASITPPADAAPAWAVLVSGRWSLVDTLERGAERVFITRRSNDTPPPPPAELSAREHEIVARAATGQSNKAIAYDLGIAPSTVAGHLSKAAAKLGVRTRVELITAFARRR